MIKPIPNNSSPGVSRAAVMWVCLVLIVGTAAVYWPVHGFEFVNFDDTDFVTNNSHVLRGFTLDGFQWAWHSEVARNWHPVTMFSHMADVQFFGVNPGRHHLTNLALHIVNSVLLFLMLRFMTGAVWRSAFVAALFAWHPMHVESVAWIAERKDLLSTMFWFLSLWGYGKYAACLKTGSGRRWGWYGVVFLFLALGLMSKPMLVTAPFLFLLLDFWPLDRMRVKNKFSILCRLVLEKIPFALLSAILCVITFRIQKQGGAVVSDQMFSLSARVQNALISYLRYIGKLAWPRHLNALYLREGSWPEGWVAVSAVVLVLVSVLVILLRHRRSWLAVGWFWYLGTLVPVIGIVQVGMQAMADRFMYVPAVGLFIIVAWTGWELFRSWRTPVWLISFIAGLPLAACLLMTSIQLSHWRDTVALFNRMVAMNPNNYVARYNLGNFYAHEKEVGMAMAQYKAALQAEPNYSDAHANLGGLLLGLKDYSGALHEYQEAIRLNAQPLYYVNMGNVLVDLAGAKNQTNDYVAAVNAYEAAIAMDPNYMDAHKNLALTLQAMGQPDHAIAEFRIAERLDPNSEAIRCGLANVFFHKNDLPDAIEEYKAAAVINPDNADTRSTLGLCYALANKLPEAEEQFRQFARLAPTNAVAQGNLANSLACQNKIAEAIPHYEESLELDPKNYQTEFNLALSLSRTGKISEAKEHYKKAIKLNPNYAEALHALAELERTGKAP